MTWPKEPPGADPWHLVIVERDGDDYDCRIVHPGCPLVVIPPGGPEPGRVGHNCSVQVEVENCGWETIFSDEPDDPTGVWLITLTHERIGNAFDPEDYWPCWHWRSVTIEEPGS